MIERSVSIQRQETRRRVAIATFLRGGNVMVRFSGGNDAIVTTAACSEYFGVIDKTFDVEPYRVVAGLTHIA